MNKPPIVDAGPEEWDEVEYDLELRQDIINQMSYWYTMFWMSVVLNICQFVFIGLMVWYMG